MLENEMKATYRNDGFTIEKRACCMCLSSRELPPPLNQDGRRKSQLKGWAGHISTAYLNSFLGVFMTALLM